MKKILSLCTPLLFLAGNLLGQVAYSENSDTLFNAGAYSSTYLTGTGQSVNLGLDYYGRAGGLAAAGSDAWYNGAWKYRQPLTVTSSNASTLSGYTVALTLNTSDIISAGRMNSDGSDIRFTTAAVSGTPASIPYYIESGINSSSTKIWVKVPSVANGSNSLYMYYGSTSAAAASSMSDAFVMGSNFTGANGSAPSTTTWVNSESAAPASGSTRTIQSNQLRLYFGSPLNLRYFGVRSSAQYSASAGRRYHAEINARTGNDSWSSFTLCPTLYTYAYDQDDWLRIAVKHSASGPTYSIERSDYGSKTTLATGSLSTGMHTVDFLITTASFIVLIDGTQVYSASNDLSFSSPYLYLEGATSNSSLDEFLFDNVYVSAYANPAPAYDSAGQEQGRRYASGTFLSSAIDTGASGTRQQAFAWADSLAAGTTVTADVRASDTNVALGTFTAVTKGGSPSVYGRYAQYRLNFATTDPRYTAWLSSATMTYVSPPSSATAASGVSMGGSAIKWMWTDSSSGQYQEQGFYVMDSSSVIKGSVASGTTYWIETGLNPNTQYTRYISGYNAAGTGPSAVVSKYTQPSLPNVGCDRSTGTWVSATLTCTNLAGFGSNGVTYYKYEWNNSPTYTAWTTTKTWSSGSLYAGAVTSGNYYLHVRSFNADGEAGAADADYGPFWYDKNAPTITGFSPSSAPWTNQGLSASVSMADTGGSNLYQVRYRWTTSSDRPYSGWQAWDSSINTTSSSTVSFVIGTAAQWYLHVEVQDAAGNVGYAYSGLYKIDQTAPTGSVVINNGDATTPSKDVTLKLTYADADSGVKEVSYRNSGGSFSAAELPQATSTWALVEGDGSKTVYYRVTDNAGNQATFADAITLDSRTTLIASSVTALASGTMGESAEAFYARAALTATPTSSALQGKTLSFYFGSTHTATTDVLGYASSAFAAPSSSGTYIYNVSFSSDSVYSASAATGSVTITQRPTALITEDVNTTSNASFIAKATLKDSYTEALISGAQVSFYFEGSTVTAVTNAVGVATVTLTAPAAVNFYDYTAAFAGNATYAYKTATSRVGVGLRVTSLVVPGVSAVAQSTFTVQATLMDGVTPVSGSQIEFYFRGSTVAAATNALGVATADFTAPSSSGPYAFAAAFAGDGTYAASSNGNTLTVTVRPLTLAGDAVQGYVNAAFQARAVLSDGITGSRVSGKTIGFRFEGQDASSVTDSNGAAVYTFSASTMVRETSCYYYFPGDEGYSAADSTAAVSVVRRPVSLAASDVSALINSTFTAIAELDDNAFAPVPLAGKTITFNYGGEFKSAVTDSLGIASVTYQSAASTGAYTFSASFAQDESYVTASDTAALTLTLRPAVISAYPRYVYAFDAIQAVADLKDGVTGVYIGSQTVTFNYNGSVKSTTTAPSGASIGRAYATYTGTGTAGNYTYYADFAGNSDYSAGSSTASITVMQRSVTLSAFPVSAIWGSTFTATAEFRDGATSAVLPGKTVRLYFQGTQYYVVTNSSGVAAAVFTAPSSTGSFSWVADYPGDAAYASASSTGTVTVNKRAPTLTAQIASKYALDSVYLSATLYDDAAPVGSRQISFYLLGSTLTATTDSGGLATAGAFASVSTPGTYGYTAAFAGDSSYSGTTSSSTLVVSARPTRLNINTLAPIAGSTFTLTATLLDYNLLTAIASKAVTFTFQGVYIGSATSNASGVASINYTAPSTPGSYTYSVTFGGSTQYSGTSSSDTVNVTLRPTVLEMADYSPAAGSTFTVSAVLKDYATGAKIASKTVSFLFLGSTRTAATDALGSAATSYVALNSTASYPISASFAGDTLYAAAAINKTVFPGRRATTVQTSDMLSAVALNAFSVSARLMDFNNGTYISGSTITFSFSGASTFTVTAVTNSTGTATAGFTAPQSTGSYTYSASFAGDSLYSANSNASAVFVDRRAVTLEPADLTSVPANSTFTASAVLKDFYTGATISTRTLTFVFVSTKTGVTNAIGVASNTFIAPVSTGTFSYKATFLETDPLYKPATSYASIGVILKPTVLEVLDVPDAVVGLKFTGTAKLKDIEAGNALVVATKTITIVFGTTTLNSVTNVGVATAAFTAPTATGTYAYTASFAGDSMYGASNSSGTVTVNRRPVLFSLVTNPNQPYTYRTNAVSSSFTITATLSDGQVAGLNLASKTIRFIFQGSQQTAVTDSLGVASVTYPSPTSSGTYAYYGYFDGDSSYNPNNPDDSIKSLTVQPRPTNILPNDSGTGILNIDGTPNPSYTFWNTSIQARVMDTLSSQGIQNVTASFVLWGSTLTGVSNSIGMAQSSASFPGVTNYGTYPAIVRFYGDATYAASELPGSTNTSDPNTGKVRIWQSPAYFDVPQITETYPDADTVITGNLLDWWNRPVSYTGRFTGSPNSALVGYPVTYKVSTIACGTDCSAVGRNWAISGSGVVSATNVASATVHSPTAAGDYPISYSFPATNSFVQWDIGGAQRVLRVGRRLTYIIPSAEPYYYGAQMPISLTLKLADVTQSLAGVNGKNLEVVLVTTQTLVTGSAGPAGTVKADFTGMSVGTYTYIARFAEGDTAYMPYTSSGTVVISKNTTMVTANDVANVPAGNSFTATANVQVVIGTYTVAGPGKTVYFSFTSTSGPTIDLTAVTNSVGIATVTYWSPYVPGSYSYTASILEDANNMGSSDVTNSVQVVKRNTALTAQNAAVYILENFRSTGTLVDTDLSNAPVPSKPLSFVLHGSTDSSAANTTNASGVATVSFLSPPAAGTYQYSATFGGDSLYALSSDTKTVTVSRRVTSIDAVDVTTPTNSGLTLYGTLNDVTFNLGVSTPVAGRTLKFTFNGTTLTGTTGADGKTSANFTTPAVAGSYPYSVTFDGDTTYANATNTRTVTVRKRLTTVSGSDLQVGAGSSFNAQALLIDEFGQKLEGYTISFVFTGTTTYNGSGATDANGLAGTIFTAPLSTGTYNYSASFAGDNTYEGFTDATNNVVVNVASTTLSTPNKTVTVNEVYIASATLLGKSSGAPVPNKNIAYTYNGASIGSALTDLSGLAVLSYTPTSTGTYRLDVGFAGDAAFYASAASATITVLRRSAGISMPDANTEVDTLFVTTATLRDTSAGAGPTAWLANRTINFTFQGTPKSAVTNALGIATVTYTAPPAAGSYQADAAFAGDATFELTSTTATVNVAKHPTQITVAAGTVAALDVFNATATLKMSGTPVASKTISFTYKGQVLTGTTDSNGQAFAQYNAGASSGPWRLDATFDGTSDTAYNTSTGSNTITVTRRNCVVLPDNITMAVFDTFNATATFKDVVNSSTPAGKYGRIAFNWIAASTFTSTLSDSAGKMYVSTGAPVSSGTYKVEAFYTGDATYAPSIASTATVTVNRRLTQLSVADVSTMYGRVFTATATLKNDAALLASKPVRFTFEGVPFTKYTDASGVATATFTVTLATGAVRIDAAFDGDAAYFASNAASGTVTAVMRPTTVTPVSASVVADKTFIATATLSDVDSLKVQGQTLSFVFNGNTLNAVTNSVGVASVTFTANVATGTYQVPVTFAGDYRFVTSSATLTVTVLRRATSIVPLSSVTVRALDVFYATSTLKDLDGINVASKPLRYVFQGSTFSLTTDASGVTVSTWAAPASSGTYYVSAYFDGDAKYEPSTAAILVGNMQRPVSIAMNPVTVPALDTFFSTATLGDIYNASYKVSARPVSFGFSWSASTAGVTDAVGVATASYAAASAAGSYVLTGTFAGDATYASTTTTVALTVTKRNAFIKGYSTSAKVFDVFLSSGSFYDAVSSAPVSGRTMKLILQQGSTLTAVTDGTGFAQVNFTANASSGTYKIYTYFDGDSTYNPASFYTSSVTLARRNSAISVAAPANTIINSSFTASATMFDSVNSSTVPAKYLTVLFQSSSFTALTDSYGIAKATYTASLTSGTYQVQATFPGDASYNPSVATTTIISLRYPTLLAAPTITVIINEVLTSTATLYDYKGSTVPSKPLVFSFQSVPFTSNTNTFGVAYSTYMASVSSGSYSLPVTFAGDALYESTNTSVPVLVNRRGSTIAPLAVTVPAFDIFTATATLSDTMVPATKLNNQSVLFEFIVGASTFSFTSLTNASGVAVSTFSAPAAAGGYQYRATFPGNTVYYPAVTVASVTVTARPSKLTLDNAAAAIDEVFTATATLTDLATLQPVLTKTVTFTFGSSSAAVTGTGGKAAVQFTAPSSSGTYQLNAAFAGDTSYAASTATSTLTVDRRPVTLTAPNITGIIDQVFTSTLTVTDKISAGPVASRQAKFVFNNSTFTVNTNASGVAVSTFSAPSSSGTYYAYITFPGDSRYLPNGTTAQMLADRRPAGVVPQAVTARAAQVFTATASLKDLLTPGTPVSGRTLTFNFSGQNFNALTDASGVAVSTFMAPASSGSAQISISFAGDSRYTASSATETVTVLRRLSLITIEPAFVKALDVVTATATLSDKVTPTIYAPGRMLAFTFRSENFNSVTDGGGIAVSTFSGIVSSGTYLVEASFAGDDAYEAAYASGTVTVLQRPVGLTASNGSAYPFELYKATATLTDGALGTPVAGRTVGLLLDGASTSAVTNAIGVSTAGFTPPGTFGDYRLDAAFAGDATYAAADSSGTVTVLRRPTAMAALDAVTTAKDVFTATAAISDVRLSTAVAGLPVVFTFQGFTSTAAADAFGMAVATFTAPVSSGTYYYTAQFKGDAVYAVSATTAAVSVLTRPTKIVAKDANASSGEPFILSAKLVDTAFQDTDPGYLVPGAQLEFKFKDSEGTTIDTAYGYTTSLGVATVTFSGPSNPGVYYYTARFTGNYTYSASSATAMVKVGLLTSLVAFNVETYALKPFNVNAKLTDYLSTTLDDKLITFKFLGTTATGLTGAGGDSGVAAASFTAPASSGTYFYTANFGGDSIYSASNATATVTVVRRPSSILTYPVDTLAYSSFTAMVVLKDVLTPEVNIGGREMNIYFNGSTATVYTDAATGVASAEFFAPYSSGTYYFGASFAGDDTYSGNVTTGVINVSLRPSNMLSYNVTDILANSTFTARVQLKDNANIPIQGLDIDFAFEGAFNTATTDASGNASVVFTAPGSSGTYTYNAVFYGNKEYAASNAAGSITVGPRATMVYAPAVSSKLGNPLAITAQLIDVTLKAGIADKALHFQFGGATLTAATDSLGYSSVTFTAPASTGTYDYTAWYDGDGTTYTGSSSSASVTIALNLTQISARNGIAIKIYEPLAVEATLKDSIGLNMPGMPVVFTFQGSSTTSVTDEFGIATAAFSTLGLVSTGTYNYTAEYPGDTLYVASSDTSNVVNVSRRDSLLGARDAVTVPGKVFTAEARLYDNVNGSALFGAAVSTRSVYFQFSDGYASTGTALTSEAGVSTVTFMAPSSTGTFVLTATFADDDPVYKGGTSTAAVRVMFDDGTGAIKTKVQVEHASAYLSKPFVSSATLSASEVAVTGKTMLFEYFNGVSTYTSAAVTSDIGLATVTFTGAASSGTYNVTVTFAGGDGYSAASGTGTVSVALYPDSLTAQDVSAYIGENFTAAAVLVDELSKNPVTGKAVTFRFFNGASTVTLSGVTDSSGSVTAVFATPNTPGSYSYTASFAGDTSYVPASDAASVLIASRGSSTFLRGYEVFIGTGEVITASATLTSKGYPVPNKNISMTFRGATVISTTGADGSSAGYFTAPASSGTYIYYLTFAGDADFNTAVATGTVSVVFRKEPEAPVTSAVVEESTVTLTWTAVTVPAADVSGYVVEKSNSLRSGWSEQGYVPSTAPALGYSCEVDTNTTTYLKVRTMLEDGQQSGTSLIIEVPPQAVTQAAAAKPNYYYMSQDESAWVKVPGEVMDKLSVSSSSFSLDIEKQAAAGFLLSYKINAAGAQQAIASAIKAGDRKGVKLSISYSQLGSVGTSADSGQMALYWFNGVEWVKIGGELDVLSGEIYTYSRTLGQFALKAAPLASSFDLTKVAPRIFTPEEASTSVNRARFYFENPDAGEVTIRIFDVTGALVRRNLESEGANVMFWNGKDQGGTYVKGGVYIYQVEAGDKVLTGTVVVAK